jgi:glycosyltransferase involved in cell wall biosynthesis
MKQHILYIYYGTQGTAGLYLKEIYESLKNQGISTSLIVSFYYPFEDGYKIFFKNTDLSSGRKKTIFHVFYRYYELCMGLLNSLRIIRISKPTHINYSLINPFLVEYLFLKFVKYTSTGLIYLTCHDTFFQSEKEIKKRAKFYNLADKIVIHNPQSLHDLTVTSRIEKAKILQHSFPIMDASYFTDNKTSHKSVKIYDFCFVGHLRKEKGIDVLINAWEIFVRKFPSTKLIIAGNIPRRASDKFIKDYRNVIFINKYLFDYEYLDLLSTSQCVVLPYTEGTNSGIPSTAMTLGTDAICSDISLFKNNQLISKDLLFCSGDSINLAEVMEHYYTKNKLFGNKPINWSLIEKYRKSFSRELLQIYNIGLVD